MPKQCCENCSDSKGGCYNNRAIDNSCPCHKPMPIHCVICKKELNGYENHLTYHKPMPISKQTIHSDFEKTFGDSDAMIPPEDAEVDVIENFYDTKIRELLDQILPKEKIGSKHDKCVMDDDYCYDHRESADIETRPNGAYFFNQAISEMRAKIKEAGF